MKSLILSISLLLWLSSCGEQRSDTGVSKEPPPLADTLLVAYQALEKAAEENSMGDFLHQLDSVEAARLSGSAPRTSSASPWVYLKHKFLILPDLDTLKFVDLVQSLDYARMTLAGSGSQIGYRQERVQYIFLLFRKRPTGWKLAAISQLEKDRFDPYGTELSYLETELPPKLRFPRRF